MTFLLMTWAGLAYGADGPICFDAQPGEPYARDGTAHCYLAVDGKLSLIDTMNAVAQERYEGLSGTLAEIDTEQEQAFLEANLPGGVSYWLGGACTGTRCVDGVVWENGGPASFEAFCEGQPGRGASDLAWRDGCWIAGNSRSQFGYLVEFDVELEPTSVEDLTCDDENDLQRCLSLTCYKSGLTPQCVLPDADHPFGEPGLCFVDPSLSPTDCGRWAWYVGECDRIPENPNEIEECLEQDVGSGGGGEDDAGGCSTQSTPLGGGMTALFLVGMGLVRRRR